MNAFKDKEFTGFKFAVSGFTFASKLVLFEHYQKREPNVYLDMTGTTPLPPHLNYVNY